MKKVVDCDKLKPFFDSTPMELHVKRFAYYISYMTGGQQEWIGKSLKQAHKGRGIKEYHFDIMKRYFKESLDEADPPYA